MVEILAETSGQGLTFRNYASRDSLRFADWCSRSRARDKVGEHLTVQGASAGVSDIQDLLENH